LGNPGTGKTTVARLLGQIYKEMGILSSGHVVLEERKNMIGRYYDSEGQAVDNALNRAKGGILLIDEAYNLYVESDDKDPGRRILECLLTALSDENNRDWMLILAGYPKEMEKMLESNPGLESRVSEKFYFDDLSEDELLQVAQLYCDDNKYELSEQARERLKAVITRDVAAKDKNFGNGRYVNKLMETAINTRMASRLSKIDSPTYDQLVTIEADDIPIDPEEAKRISSKGFDDAAIDEALKRLDSLVGLGKVKSAIHNFVNISRFLNSQGDRFRGKGLLKWNFTGNTGTGKSTVAQILADILKAMNLIQNNELTEVKGEEIFNVSDYTCNEVIRDAVKRSRRGLLFIDGDAPEFRSSQYRMTGEQIRFKLASLASDESASGAVVIAECSTSNLSIAHSLASNGIYDFDHTFIFDDYSADELYSILLQCLDKQNTTVSKGAEAILREYINNLCANRELSFANARTMKNLSRAIFETVILRMTREAAQGDRVVLAEDVESFVWKKISSKIGFQ
jgi:adenylate kinase family enzyme